MAKNLENSMENLDLSMQKLDFSMQKLDFSMQKLDFSMQKLDFSMQMPLEYQYVIGPILYNSIRDILTIVRIPAFFPSS
jgi:hypothetical protein